jgi:3',5'-cyclic AMP phosphodiesterase CpdA
MRTIVHLSDLHFGRTDARIVRPLIRAVREIGPDLVAVSGDLTQRARVQQFLEARAFLDELPGPQIVVPGNHDIPLHNVYARFFNALDKYRRIISHDLEPFYHDDEIAVAGVNTARSLTFQNGRINALQVARTVERLCAAPADATRIIVAHHPFDLPGGFADRMLVGRADMAMRRFAACGANVFLSGHLHLSYTAIGLRYHLGARSALVIQAGTAISTRGRGELNSFNLIRTGRESLAVERLRWDAQAGNFKMASAEQYRMTPQGWQRDRA